MSPADDIDTLQLGPDPDKLELYHRQQLSAMLDGELPQDQARFLRRRLQHRLRRRQRRRNRRRQNLPLIRQINHSPRELALRPRLRLLARQA